MIIHDSHKKDKYLIMTYCYRCGACSCHSPAELLDECVGARMMPRHVWDDPGNPTIKESTLEEKALFDAMKASEKT